MKVKFVLFAALSLSALAVMPVRGDDKKSDPTKPPVIAPLDKPAPENIEDLRAIQGRVKDVLRKVVPATVGIRIGGASGSGVIINKEGHVLTAGHVSGTPDKECVIIFPNGKKVKGKSLGGNGGIDSGLIQITEKGDWPFVDMGKSTDLKRGQWVIAVGHPGGFNERRSPPVRLGRILEANRNMIRTDCTLVGGDSGGPLFDMDGKVIGIHSRIAGNITDNIHVPVDTYRDTWDRLVKGERWGGGLFGGGGADMPYMGVELEQDSDNCKVKKITPGSPAEKAGIKEGDVILSFAGQKIAKSADLAPQLFKKKIGDRIALELKRGEETVKLEIKLGRRNN